MPQIGKCTEKREFQKSDAIQFVEYPVLFSECFLVSCPFLLRNVVDYDILKALSLI